MRGDAHTNTFDFRYNQRAAFGVTDAERASKTLAGIVGKRLTYRRLTSEPKPVKASPFGPLRGFVASLMLGASRLSWDVARLLPLPLRAAPDPMPQDATQSPAQLELDV